MIRAWLLVLLSIGAIVFAQEYVESSGRTLPFDLKPGAKAAWDKNASGIHLSPIVKPKSSAFALTSLIEQKRITFVATGTGVMPEASVSIYRLDGVLIDKATTTHSHVFTFENYLPNGYYWVRLESDGKSLALTRMLLAR